MLKIEYNVLHKGNRTKCILKTEYNVLHKKATLPPQADGQNCRHNL